MKTTVYKDGVMHNDICGIYRHDNYFSKSGFYSVIFNMTMLNAVWFIDKKTCDLHKYAVIDNYGNLVAVGNYY